MASYCNQDWILPPSECVPWYVPLEAIGFVIGGFFVVALLVALVMVVIEERQLR